MHVTEILLTKDVYTAEDWRKLVMVVAKHIGGLQPFDLVVEFRENHVRFYIDAKKDISALSGGLDGFMLRGVDASETDSLNVPQNASSQRFMRIPTGGSILDIKERCLVQQGRQLALLRLKIRRVVERLSSTMYLVTKTGDSNYVTKQHLTLFPAHFFAMDITESQNYIFSSMPKYVSLEKTLHLLQTDDTNAVFSVPGFPYSTKDYYLPLSAYQFDKHSLIVGASGSGKSRLIQLIIDRIEKYGASRDAYRIVVIDPHASLEEDLQHINGSKIINLGNESAQLFPDANADISAATELTTTLFQSLLASQYNPRLERVLRFTVYVLLTAQIMSLDNLKKYLTDLDMRMQVLKHVDGFVPQNIQQFFSTDFNELRTQHYTDAILPIVSLVDEMQLQPSLVGEAANSLAKTIEDNFLSVFSLNKVSMGEKAVKTVAGLLIQQIFLIAQARIMPYKLMLIIDEVSVVQNPALASILAEARKFNLSVIITQQYFSQVNDDIRDAILGNIVNYYVFRVSEEDAVHLEGNMVIEIPKELIEKGREKGLDEAKMKINMLTSQSVRECFVRVAANGQLMPAIKAATVDIGGGVQERLLQADEPVFKPKLNKLPQKMILENTAEFQAARASVAELSAVPALPMPTGEPNETILHSVDVFTQPAVINIQQILADQSSSRKNVKGELKL